MRSLLVLSLLPLVATSSLAQGPDDLPRLNPSAVRKTDKRAEDLQQAYLKQLDAVATDYLEAGAIDKAKETMQTRLKVAGDDRVAGKLAELEELDFVRNKHDFTLDPSTGWTSTDCQVQKGQTIRLAAEGTYRLIYNEELTADGVKTESLASDFVKGAPLGTLIGTIVPPTKKDARGRPVRRKNDEEKPLPFVIGSSDEIKPEISGRLYLKVNIPPDTKAVGELRIKISGRFSR